MKDFLMVSRHFGTGLLIGSSAQLILAYCEILPNGIFIPQGILFIVGAIWFGFGEYFYLKGIK